MVSVIKTVLLRVVDKLLSGDSKAVVCKVGDLSQGRMAVGKKIGGRFELLSKILSRFLSLESKLNKSLSERHN